MTTKIKPGFLALFGAVFLMNFSIGLQYGQAQCSKNSQFSESVNTFDWRSPEYPVFIKLIDNTEVLMNITSPFYLAGNLYQPNTRHFAVGLDKDVRLEEGWELVTNHDGIASGVSVKYPTYVLYNRHTSTLRVFRYLSQGTANEALLELRHENGLDFNGSAMLSAIELPVRALDQVHLTKSYVAQSPNVFESSNALWVYQDIPIVYDPCVCSFASSFLNQTTVIDVDEISLTLEGDGSITQIVDDGSTEEPSGFASTINKLTESGKKVHKGIKAYQSGDKLLEDFFDTSSSTQSSSKTPMAVPGFMKSLPYVGAAFTIMDAFFGGGKTAETEKPLNFDINLDFVGTGDITSENEIGSVACYVPGSDQSGLDPTQAPIYDNPLGIFSIVETPVVQQASIREDIFDSDEGHDDPYGDYYDWDPEGYRRYYRLKDDIKFAVNPHAGVELMDVRASFYFRENTLSPETYTVADQDNSRERTAYIPLECFEEGIVSTGPLDGNPRPVLSVAATFRSTENPGLDPILIKYPIDYRIEKISSPSAASAFADQQNDIFTIPEFLDVDIADVVDGQVFRAWNEINIIPDCRTEVNPNGSGLISICNGKDIIVSAPSYAINGNPFSAPTGNVGISVNSPLVGIEFDASLTDCGPPLPVSASFLASFCNDPNKYDPSLASLQDEPDLEMRSGEPSGYDSEGLNEEVVAYPNPLTEGADLVLSISLAEEVHQMHVRISNLQGQSIVSSATRNSLPSGKFKLRIPTEGWNSGQYICIIQLDDRTVTKMISKL